MDLLDPGVEPWSPALQTDSLSSEPPGKPDEKNNVYWKGVLGGVNGPNHIDGILNYR